MYSLPFSQYAIAERLSSGRLALAAVERSVEHERRCLEAGIDVAVRPLERRVGRLAHRQRPSPAAAKSASVHLCSRISGRGGVGRAGGAGLTGRGRGLGRGHAHPDIPRPARVRRRRAQRLDRIDVEGQRLVLDADQLDRLGGGQFVDGGDGENRFAAVQRLVGERPLVERARLDDRAVVGDATSRSREIVGGQDRLDAGQRERGARVDARTRACGMGLRRSLANSIPSAR